MASIMFSVESQNGQPHVFVITSPGQGEGKTTSTCNLGIALAEINRRVLLVDGDIRLPRLHSVFDLENSRGLSDILSENKPVKDYLMEELVLKTNIPGLYVLPSGSVRTDLSPLLYSPRLPDLFNRFRSEFTVTLIDTPPVLNLPDARVVGRSADSVILVLRANTTTRHQAAKAIRYLEEDNTPILGTILNDWNPNTAGYARYYSTGSYR
jgi:capsular exopolysaccharide synthesis family protein